MSGRKLGGGRVLGSGKGLAPPQPAPRAARPASPYAYAPSDSSSVSVSNSQVSLSPPLSSTAVPDFGPQDLASRISIGGPSNGAAGAGQRLVCPICEEEMVCALYAVWMGWAMWIGRATADTHVYSSRCYNSTGTLTICTKNYLKKSKTRSKHGSTSRS